jgi:hypothetical protein
MCARAAPLRAPIRPQAHADAPRVPLLCFRETRLDAAPTREELAAGLTYFGNRLCPFAHRAWWAMHEKRATHEARARRSCIALATAAALPRPQA